MIIRHSRAVSQGKQGLFWGGAAGGLPSPPPAGALSPAGSGDAAQWAASITDRGGSRDAGTALAVTERARRWLTAQLQGSHFLGALPAGKGGAKPLFPYLFLMRCAPIRSRARSRLFEKRRPKNFYACSPKVYLSFQMSRSYSVTERSEEKYPALAIFTSIFLAQAARSS